MSKMNQFHEGHYFGLTKLLAWCVKEYKTSNSPNGKQMWRDRINFLAEKQKQQFYTEDDKVKLNKLRNQYQVETKLGKHAIGSTNTI